jgi:hypothetical protein
MGNSHYKEYEIVYNYFTTLLAQIGGSIFLIGCLIMLPLSFITVPYLNKKLGLKKLYNPLGQDFLIGSPSIQYATMIVFNKRTKKSSYTRSVFGAIDLQENARLIDKILSYLFVILAGGGILLDLFSLLLVGLSYL